MPGAVVAIARDGKLFASIGTPGSYGIMETTPQFMANMMDFGMSVQAAIEAPRVRPGEMNRAMVEGRPDWCISRQRAWGVPIAIFVEKKTGMPLREKAVLDRIVEIFRREGSDAWWKRPASDFLGPDHRPEDFEQVFDIVDVWFESGATHAFVLEGNPDLTWPADLYLEGSDQHRGWFQSSLLESCGTRGVAPFKNVLTHGFILDEKGYKMSTVSYTHLTLPTNREV